MGASLITTWIATEYKEKFNHSGKKDLLKEVEADMKKIDEELKEISS